MHSHAHVVSCVLNIHRRSTDEARTVVSRSTRAHVCSHVSSPQRAERLAPVMTTGTRLRPWEWRCGDDCLESTLEGPEGGVCSPRHSPLNEAPHCGDGRKGTKDGLNCHTEYSYSMLVAATSAFQTERTENDSVRHTEPEFWGTRTACVSWGEPTF